MRTILKRLSVLGLLMALASIMVFGQAISGDLVGTVRDNSGAVLPNVNVELTNLGTGLKLSQKTTSVGDYHFSNLPVGHYKLNVQAENLSGGFSDVEVRLNQTITANVVAQVAGHGTTIEVTGSAETIDTTTAQIQNTYDTKQLQDLPSASVGLGVLNLSLLSSGVASSGGVGVGTGPSVSGQRPRNNNFTVEGVDNNSKSVTGPIVTIPNDAVQSFTVLQNQYSPEFGHSSGGQFNQTVLSGTNKFHGRAYEYFQNRNLNAIDAHTALSETGKPFNPRYDNNRFGGQIGGPILKDKLFFFSNNEYNPQGFVTGGYYVCAPTATGYAQMAALATANEGAYGPVNSNNFGVYQQYMGTAAAPTGGACSGTLDDTHNAWVLPDGNAAATGYEIGLVDTNSAYYANQFTTTNSIDWNISSKDQVRGRYVYQHYTSLDVAANIPSFWTPLPVRNTLVTINEYHTFTSNLTNEFRAGFNRNTQFYTVGPQTFPGLDTFPNLAFFDTSAQLGADPNSPQFGIQNIYQGTDNLSWIKGKHSFKFGGEFRKYISPQGFTQRARGDYEWSNTSQYLYDVAPDYIGERSSGNTTYYGDQTATYIYAGDEWKVRPNLSLTFGLRYEFTTVPYSERLQTLNQIASVPGLIEFNKPQPQGSNFAPRVGFAWSPGTEGNTSIRGGFGMAYDVLFDNLGLLTVPPQLGATCDVGNEPSATCYYGPGGGGGFTQFMASGALPAGTGSGITVFPDQASAASATGGYVPDQKLPYTLTWNLGVQHQFGGKYIAEVRYVGTRGVHLPVQDRLNKQARVTPSLYLPTFIGNVPDPDTLTTTLADVKANKGGTSTVPVYAANNFTSSITSYQPYGNSLYNGMQAQLNRNFTNGLQFQAAWTWSHAGDDSTAEVFSTQLTPRRPQDFQNVRGDWGTSALDRRHRFTVQVLYDMPFFKNGNWMQRNVLGNWEFAPVYTFQSPEYYTAQSAVDANLNGDTAGDRTIYNTQGKQDTGSSVHALLNSGGATVGYVADNPNAMYIEAGPGALANVSRNTVALPHINNVDLTVVKRLNFTERMSFEFQAQALNVFNHSQYVAGNISSVAPIGFTSITNFVAVGSPNFNQPNLFFSNNPRTMQLAMKFIF